MAPPKQPEKAKGIKVISRPPIFRRAGFQFTQEPTLIALADLTDEQIKALRAETNLVVIDVEIDPPAESPKQPAPDAA